MKTFIVINQFKKDHIATPNVLVIKISRNLMTFKFPYLLMDNFHLKTCQAVEIKNLNSCVYELWLLMFLLVVSSRSLFFFEKVRFKVHATKFLL